MYLVTFHLSFFVHLYVYMFVYCCAANHMTCIYPKLLINTLVSAPSPWPEKVTLPPPTILFTPACLLVCYLFSNSLICHIPVCLWERTVHVLVFVPSVCLLNALSLRSREHKWTESQIKLVHISFHNLV